MTTAWMALPVSAGASQYQLSKDDQVSVGLQNLFNRDYYPLYSQLMRSSNNTSHLPAPGTVLTASYTHQW
ncbi:hypothetical protein D3C78_1510600 [compost metagenome]